MFKTDNTRNLRRDRAVIAGVLFCIFMVFSATRAEAKVPLDASRLAEACRSVVGQANIQCFSYMGGVLDTHRLLNKRQNINPIICAPFLPPDERRQKFNDYIAKKKPDTKNKKASELVEEVFSAIYPCK